MSKSNRKLANYILDKSLQLRYVGFVTALSALLASVLGYMIFLQERRASESIISTLGDSGLPMDFQQEIIRTLAKDDTNLVMLMGLIGLGLSLVLVLYLVVMTHKVAGPLFKVSKYFDEMAVGKLSEVYPLRKGDQLQGFYDNFKRMHDTVRARHQANNAAVTALLDACEAAGLGDGGELGHKLAEARSHARRREQLLV